MTDAGLSDDRLISDRGDFFVTPAQAPMDGFFASVLVQKTY
jgi:hypothetical protein